MRPRIALTVSRLDVPDPRARELRRRARARYVAALEGAGAEVVTLEPGAPDPPGATPSIAFDALCLSGGEDVAPSRYGQENVGCETIDPERDELELALLRDALDRDLPVLGVCRGFQVLNVAFGGSLLQDRAGHRPVESEGVVAHVVAPAPGSRLAAACGGAPQMVNSRHHQVVTDRELAPGLRVTVRVDELVEAFEAEGHRFVVGVQWHPERTDEVAPEARRIFAAFVSAASRSPASAR